MIIGTGIDIVEIERMERAIKRWGNNFLHHVFCAEEIEYSQSKKYPPQHFAARFAAKEAVLKALTDNQNVLWKDIKILNHPNGQPYCEFNQDQFQHRILISMSHSKSYAVASAIIT